MDKLAKNQRLWSSNREPYEPHERLQSRTGISRNTAKRIGHGEKVLKVHEVHSPVVLIRDVNREATYRLSPAHRPDTIRHGKEPTMPPRTAEISTVKPRQRVMVRLVGEERRIYYGAVSAVDSVAIKLNATGHQYDGLGVLPIAWKTRETVVIPWRRVDEITIKTGGADACADFTKLHKNGMARRGGLLMVCITAGTLQNLTKTGRRGEGR
jgi:hypothetical protein